MKSRDEENLKSLFEKFLDSKGSEQALDDIRKGEQILGEHAAPEPGRELIGDIKAEVAEVVLHKKTGFRRMVYKTAAVAAAVITLTAMSVRLFEKGGGKPERVISVSVVPKAVWESEDLVTDDADLAILSAEIEQIEGEILAVKLGENGGNGGGDLAELEMELLEINSDFWKG